MPDNMMLPKNRSKLKKRQVRNGPPKTSLSWNGCHYLVNPTRRKISRWLASLAMNPDGSKAKPMFVDQLANSGIRAFPK